MGLYRIVVHYLIPNLPDKKYTWIDFIYKGSGSSVSGFYAGGNEDSFSLWTLSGLKTFYALPNTSAFIFRDTCAVVKQIKDNGSKSVINPEQRTFYIDEWRNLMKPEYFATVQLLGDESGKNLIDKAWGVSGKYKVLGRVDRGVCD